MPGCPPIVVHADGGWLAPEDLADDVGGILLPLLEALKILETEESRTERARLARASCIVCTCIGTKAGHDLPSMPRVFQGIQTVRDLSGIRVR